MKGLLLALVLAAPVSAEVCGSISVAGGPLPAGRARLIPDERAWKGDDAFGGGAPKPGPDERALIPVRDGRFCFEGVRPGNYRLSLTPFATTSPHLPTDYEGIDGRSVGFRLTFGADGKARVYDDGGRLRADSLPPLRHVPGMPRDEGSLDVELDLPEALAAKDGLLVAVRMAPDTDAWRFHRVSGPAPAGTHRFSVRVAPGYVEAVRTLTSGWAVRNISPGIVASRVVVEVGRSSSVRVGLARAGAVNAAVSLPDGNPFRPKHGARYEDQRHFVLKVKGLASEFEALAFADGEGRLLIEDVPPGLHEVYARGQGGDFPFAVPPAGLVRVETGKTASLTLRLRPAATATLAREPGFDNRPGARWTISMGRTFRILGLPDSPMDAGGASAFLATADAAFEYVQDSSSAWVAHGAMGPETTAKSVRLASGAYTAWLVDRGDPMEESWVRPLASTGVLVAAGVDAVFSFPNPVWVEGSAIIHGRFQGAPAPAMGDLLKCRTLSELHARIAPRVLFTDAEGRWAGAAFARVSENDLLALSRALADGDEAGLRRIFPKTRRFEMKYLPPGEFTARAEAFGAPARTRSFSLAKGSLTKWEVDW